MIRLLAPALILLASTTALAQERPVAPPVIVGPAPAPVTDPAATEVYVADFSRLCLDTGGERAAVRAAVQAAGWSELPVSADGPNATDIASWGKPDGSGAMLMTSASRPGEMADGVIVRTCILIPANGSAGPPEQLAAAVTPRVGWPGQRNGQGMAWIFSGTAQNGWRDELPLFIAAGTAEAGLALAVQRPILMLTLVDAGEGSGLALLRAGVE